MEYKSPQNAKKIIDKFSVRMFSHSSEVAVNLDAEKRSSLKLPTELHRHIIPDTLNIFGIPVTFMQVVEVPSSLTKVKICEEDGSRIDGVLIDPITGMVRETDTGLYRFVMKENILFSERPSGDCVKILFDLETPGNVTLSYMVKNLSWRPLCEIDIFTGLSEFWVILKNETDVIFDTNRIGLCIENETESEIQEGATFIEWQERFRIYPKREIRRKINQIKFSLFENTLPPQLVFK